MYVDNISEDELEKLNLTLATEQDVEDYVQYVYGVKMQQAEKKGREEGEKKGREDGEKKGREEGRDAEAAKVNEELSRIYELLSSGKSVEDLTNLEDVNLERIELLKQILSLKPKS